MIKKLLPLALLLPMMAVAQTGKQAQEIQAKALAAQNETPSVVIAQRVLDCAALDVPYTENFESVTVPGFGECTSLENAGTGNNWETAANPGYGFGTTKVMRYKWNTDSAANAWFFTAGLNLTAGQAYNISYRYGSAGANVYTEKLKVHVGMLPTSADMNAVPLIDHPLVNNNVTPLVDNLFFTPETSGVYFFGFNCYSNIDQFYLFVDDIAVSEALATDSFDSVQLRTYPNPVSEIWHVEAAQKVESVTVFNLLGQTVNHSVIGGQTGEVDLRMLARGNYLAKVVSGSSQRMVKIVKN